MTNNEFVKNNVRVNTLAEKLRSKLKNFTVLDRQSQVMGQVKDLILDNNRQLNLVVSRLNTAESSGMFLLKSKLIQNIDPSNQSVLVNMDKAEIENLPEYTISETLGIELSEAQNSLLTPSQEAAHEGITKDSEIASATVMPTPLFESQNIQSELDYDIPPEAAETPEVLEEEIIRLLGERLVVDRGKRKIGEVIVRKEIETRMIQVPVRFEKLIVEQVNPEQKQLAEINLGQQEVAGIELSDAASIDTTAIASTQTPSLDSEPTVRGEFNSPKIASLLLNAIALERRHGCKKVRVEVVVEDAERQKLYQEWVNRSSGNQPNKSD
jgi:stress response protein YsnF